MEETRNNGVLNIGFDPGFGGVKAAWIGPSGAQVATVPSVIGIGQTDLGLLSIGSRGPQKRSRQPDQVSFDSSTYLAGENVARYARPIERMDYQRLGDGPELRTLFYAVTYRLLGEGAHAANLMVGLPVEVMADGEQARATLRMLRSWMVAEHRHAVNGHQVDLTIRDVRVMAQPAGAFFAWGLDDLGRWVRPKDDLWAPVAICDIGFNTLDLFTVQAGEVVGRFTGGDTLGMRRAAETLASRVRSAFGVGLSLHEADALLQHKQPRLHTSRGEQDMRAEVHQALDVTAAAVISFVERQWGNGRQFAHLLFTGGGAESLRDALLRHYPHGVTLPNPVTANALGLARYAARVFAK